MNMKPSEQAALLAVIDPDQQAAATVTSAWVDMSKFSAALALIQTGVLGASATVNAKLEQATDSGGSGVKDVTGKAITQLVKASNDDDQAQINCLHDDLDVAGGFRFVRLSITVGTAASFVSGSLWGFGPIHGPADKNDLASVVEIK